MTTKTLSRIYNFNTTHTRPTNFTRVKFDGISTGETDIKLIGLQLNILHNIKLCMLKINNIIVHTYWIDSNTKTIGQFFQNISESIIVNGNITTVILKKDISLHKGDELKFCGGYCTVGISPFYRLFHTSDEDWRRLTFIDYTTNPGYVDDVFMYKNEYIPKYLDVFLKLDGNYFNSVRIGRLNRGDDLDKKIVYVLSSDITFFPQRLYIKDNHSLCLSLYSDLYDDYIKYHKLNFTDFIVYTFEFKQNLKTP